MSNCQHCGAHTRRGAYCSTDCRLAHTAEQRTQDLNVYECPDCDGETSGPGVTCADCRRDGPDPVEQLGGDHQ